MRKLWTDEEVAYLKENFPNTLTSELSAKMGRSLSGIAKKAKEFGLKKSESYMKEMLDRTKQNLLIHGSKYHFKKGMIPKNKGGKFDFSKMSPEKLANFKKAHFQKGQVPHNKLPIGSERVHKDGYIVVKVRDNPKGLNNYEFKHRWIYEQHHGPIPKRSIITFVDGNNRNFDIENLKMLSHEEHHRRTVKNDRSILSKFFKVKDRDEQDKIIEKHPEIIEAKRLQISLNGKITKLKYKQKNKK